MEKFGKGYKPNLIGSMSYQFENLEVTLDVNGIEV